jgi:hypothetical protein
LAWYKPNAGSNLIAFSTHLSNGGPAIPVAMMDYNDGLFHPYVIKNYKDIQDGCLKVQVLIDGTPQLNPPAQYADSPESRRDPIFGLSTNSPAQVKILLREISLGPIGFIPPVPESSGLSMAAASPPRRLSPQWNWDEERKVNSSEVISLTHNRTYTLKGRTSTSASGNGILVVSQYQGSYPEPDPSTFVVALSPGLSFSQDFQLKYGFDKITLLLRDEAPAKIESLEIAGGGFAVPLIRLPRSEPIPPLSTTASRLSSQPTMLFRREPFAGAPKLLLNGEPTSLFFHKGPLTDRPSYEIGYYAMFREYGVMKHEVPTVPWAMSNMPFWLAKDKYDFTSIDAVLRRLASSIPDGAWFLELSVDPYAQWGDEHPEEVVRNDSGKLGYGTQHLLGWGARTATARYLPSALFLTSSRGYRRNASPIGCLYRKLTLRQAGRRLSDQRICRRDVSKLGWLGAA